jgi:hypothetical protein
MQAAHAAGTEAIGYANKPGKYSRLLDLKPNAAIHGMSELVTSLTV